MKTQDEFIDDIFSKVSKRHQMFAFGDGYVRISFKYETDLLFAIKALKKSYGSLLRVNNTVTVYNE